MTAAAFFSGQFFAVLGWALFHFLWQGALVAALLAGIVRLFRGRSPALRYALSCGALATMLALPVATAWSLAARRSDASPASRRATTASAATPVLLSSAAEADGLATGSAFLPRSLRDRVESLRPWALSAWFAGVLLLSIRFLGGLAAARRLTRRGTRPAPQVWQETLARIAGRLAISRPVRLLESTVVKVPTAIGAFRPVILFPATVFLGLPTRGLEALIAHELAHVRRHDYLVNLLQAFAETLLFYHPAVWWVSARIRVEREQSCDDLAIAATGDARSYARALMRLEEMRGAAPALAVAAGGGNLWKRVVRLLAQNPSAGERPSAWVAGALAFAMLALLGAAARVGPSGDWSDELGGASPVIESSTPDAVVRPAPEEPSPAPEPTAPEETDVPAPEAPAVEAPAAEAPLAETPDEPVPEVAEEPSIESGASSALQADDAEEPEQPGEPEIEERPAPAGTRALTADELSAFRVHGVTPEFVRSIAALGYERADSDDLVALKIHGVTPEDISEMNAVFGKRPLEEHVSFKIHGVTREEVRRLSALKLGKLSPDDVVSMKIHGVDAAYVDRLRAGGYANVSAEDAISARIHGVAPSDAEAWNRLGFGNVSIDDLVGARIHGATPEFAAAVRAVGFSNTSLEDVVAFRIHGVDEEFLREMKSLGLAPPAFTADDAVAFRIHGVTPEYVRQIRSLGYADASPEDLTELRIHGVSAEQIRQANARAGRRLSLETLIERHACGKDDDDED
jgi:beta-lactamase regulating signal transducer with metallopeptidase domain